MNGQGPNFKFQLKAILQGLLSHSNVLYLMVFSFSLILLWLLMKYKDSVPVYPVAFYLILFMAIGSFLSAVLKANSLAGQSGPPEVHYSDERRQIALTFINVLTELPALLKLTVPTGEVVGSVTEGKIKEFTEQDKQQWPEKHKVDVVKQLGEQILKESNPQELSPVQSVK